MARIRSIKPAFFRNFGLFQLEQTTGLPVRVAFSGLWTAADRSGRFRWRPQELKLDCLPFDRVDFDEVLNAMARGGYIVRYEVGGDVYGYIPGWVRHQRPRNDEETSQLPDPPEQASETVTNPSLLSDEPVTTETLGKERKGKEGKGKGEEGGETPAASAAARQGIVLEFPTDGDPKTWKLRAAQVHEWQQGYPKLDVIDECQRALVWIRANADKRKKASGMPKFLVNWLNRSSSSARSNGNGHHPPTSTERKRAEDVRRRLGGCMHNPRCGSYAECIATIVQVWRGEGLGDHP